MVNFTIFNNSDMALTYEGVTIDSNQSYVVSTEPERFASNGNLLADIYNSWVDVTIGNQTFTGAEGMEILIKINNALSRLEYFATMGALADGYVQALQGNMFGELAVQYRNKYQNITGNQTVVVKSGPGRLHGIIVNDNSTGGSFILYDNTAGSGTKIGTFAIGNPASLSGAVVSPIFMGPLGLEFSTGLTVVTSGSTSNDITLLYQ